MTTIGPELALIRARTVHRTAIEDFAHLEYQREDPVRIQAQTLAAELARHYSNRIDRASIPVEFRQRNASVNVRRPGLWVALKARLSLEGRRGVARRTT